MAGIADYFEVISIEDKVLNIALRGFWSDQVIEEHSAEIQEAFKKAIERFGGKRFILVADWSESPIFGTKAQGHLAESMRLFKEHNGYKVIEIVPRALVRMGLKKAADQSGKDDFRVVVRTRTEAQEALERLLPEI